MIQQLTYEDVQVGMEIPPLVKETSTRLSAQWAGASGDYDPIHYDREYAKIRELPDAVVNGRLRLAWLIQLITNWIGTEGVLKKIECRQKGFNIVGEAVKCRGVVIGKDVQSGEYMVECEIWTENSQGEKTATGKSVVQLPLKNDP